MNRFEKPSLLLLFIHFLLILGVTGACGKKPAVEEEGLKNPFDNIGHVNFLGDCADCHETERKAPAVDLNITVAHGFGKDCSECHTFPVFGNLKAELIAHNPPPTQCMGCHNRITENTQHPPFGECASCHRFTSGWAPF